MFKFIHVGGPYSDCTESYILELDKKYTVGEFIETVLKEMPNDWGYIHIYFKDKFYSCLSCEYNHGIILNNSILKEHAAFEIKSVRASGGWSRMDYRINFDLDEIERKHREAFVSFTNMVAEKRKQELKIGVTVDISPVEIPEILPTRKKR